MDIRGTAGVANSHTNIIIRNITFQDTYDCFPQWSPTDSSLGSWNALYDSISLRDSNNVWSRSQHVRRQGDRRQHGAELFRRALSTTLTARSDITNASDLVTVSWNHFTVTTK